MPAEARTEPLRKALVAKNNFIVAKAADLVREFALALIPDLLAAFDRFLENPVKSDPQCWAKNAISRALAAMEYQEAEVFLRGMRHIQMEPVWGGQFGHRGTLRATCALALVQCRSVTEPDCWRILSTCARTKKICASRGGTRHRAGGIDFGALLLRLRATLGADEPEVLGACYGGVLRIEGVGAIPWVARFLAAGDDPPPKRHWPLQARILPRASKRCKASFADSRTTRGFDPSAFGDRSYAAGSRAGISAGLVRTDRWMPRPRSKQFSLGAIGGNREATRKTGRG